MSNPARTEEEVNTILVALAAWGGQINPASKYLKAEKGIAISPATLKDWKTRYGERYDRLREQNSASAEGTLAHEMREVALLAVGAERLAVEKTVERLESGEETDTARAAANLSRVAQSSVDKLMSLTGRPTQITETRDAFEIMRKLVQMGVLQAPDEPTQIEEATLDPAPATPTAPAPRATQGDAAPHA